MSLVQRCRFTNFNCTSAPTNVPRMRMWFFCFLCFPSVLSQQAVKTDWPREKYENFIQGSSLQNETIREQVGISEAENLESEETFEILCPRSPNSTGKPFSKISVPSQTCVKYFHRALISTL